MTAPVLVECRADGVAIVTLNRSDHLNALTEEMVQSLREAFVQLDANSACRVILLHANGRMFSAGYDLKSADPGRNTMQLMAGQALFGGTPGVIRGARQPVIAAIHGAAVGAGFAIALAADIRIAARSAKFLNGAIKIGLSAGESGISYHLPRLVGAGRAFEIMLTGRPVLADEALAIGLVTQIVDDSELMLAALKLAESIAANSPYANSATKRLMWQNLEASTLDEAVELENHIQTVAMTTGDFQEGVRAFIEKRTPTFTGG